jgi:hypothetical protein
MKFPKPIQLTTQLAAASALFAIASISLAADIKQAAPSAMNQAVTVMQQQPWRPAAPDLEVILSLGASNPVNIVYPYQSFYVKNIGTADAPPSTLEVTCSRFKGSDGNFQHCSAAGKFNVPALPAPKVPNDPNSRFIPTTGWTPGGMPCDKWDDQAKKWLGITHCVIEATADADHQVPNDSNKLNNKKTITIYTK